MAGYAAARSDRAAPRTGEPLTLRRLAEPEINVALKGDLVLALIHRGGLRQEEGQWVGPEGRRTAAIAEAVLWVLLRIAAGVE